MIRSFIVCLLLSVIPAWASPYVVDPTRLPFAGSWSPNTTNGTGVPGGIPTRTNLINVTVSPYTADPTGAVDCTATVQAAIDAGADGDVIYFPDGTYKVSGTLVMANPATHNSHHITMRGQSQAGVHLVGGTSPVIQIGSPSGFGTPSGATLSDLTVSAGLTAGSSSITIGDTSRIPNGTLIRITPVNDPSIPTLNVDAAPSTVGQIVRVGTKSGSTVFPISPKLFDDYGGGSLFTSISVAPFQGELVGVESLTVDLTVSDRQTGISLDNAWSCWVKDVKVVGAENYQISMQFTCQCEIRHSYTDGLGKAGTNHAGILHNYGSSDLIEDDVIVGSFPVIEQNAGSSGNVWSRNYGSGSFMNSNHGSTNRYNLFEANYVVDAGGGILDDGYFGGSYRQTYYDNVWGFQSLKRNSRSATFVGNFSLQNDTDFQLGYPNLSNNSFTGTSNAPSIPDPDYGMTGTITAVTKGTGTGYVTSGSAVIGDKQVTLTAGTGTIIIGDVLTFSGSPQNQFKYYVTAALTGGVVHFVYQGGSGLQNNISGGTAVTVSSDTGQLTYSGGSLSGDGGAGSQTPNLWWASYANQAKYRVLSNSGHVAQIGSYVAGEANATSLPAVSTAVVVGAGIAGFQTLDLGVEATLLKAGNRYANNVFDSIGSATSLSPSLMYVTSPQWLIDERAMYSQSFPLQAFDPITPVQPSGSDIPSGYRFLRTVPPLQQSASINTAGTQLSVTFNKPLTVGSGGSGGMTLSGGTVTLLFVGMVGSTAVYNTSRQIGDEETFTNAYTQPGSGLRAASNNVDLPSYSGLAVTNGSQQSQGSVWIQRITIGQTNSVISANQNAANLMAVDIPSAGNITKIRVAVGPVNLFHDACKVALLDSAGNVLVQATGTLNAQNDYQAITIDTTHVTAGLYYVALLVNSNGDPDLAYLSNTGANSSFYSFNNAGYSAQFISPQSFSGANTGKLSFGVRFTPDAQPSTITVTNRLNVGTLRLP